MKKATQKIELTPLQVREAALTALVSERTMQKFIRGEPVRDSTRERIRRGLAGTGFLPAKQASR